MPNSFFKFKQFVIKQDACAAKVNTDSVLLGALADVKNANYILDIGTGTGVIAIMLAQRCEAIIHAIEIDSDSSKQAQQNVSDCRWNNRIQVFNTSLQYYQSNLCYDLVICNPPYYENSLKSNTMQKNLWRHTDSLSYDDLFYYTSKLLHNNGLFYIIIPFRFSEKIIEKAITYKFFVNKIINVKPYPQKLANRTIMAFSKKQCSILTKLLIINETVTQFTPQFKELIYDFYLDIKP